MDDIIDALVDPIEDDGTIHKKIHKKKFPDEFRPYLFSNPEFKPQKNIFTDSEKTNTKLKYWMTDLDKITQKIIIMINKYKTIKNPIALSFTKKIPMKATEKNYYNKIYTLADIIISRNSKYINMVLKDLLAMNLIHNHIYHRLVIYFAVYFCKKCKKNRKRHFGFIKTVINKLQEYASEPNILNYFTKTELDNYIAFLRNLLKYS